MSDQQHVTESGRELMDVERLARQSRLDSHLDTEPFGGDPCGLDRAQLGTRQARVEPYAKTPERASRDLRLTNAALSQRTLGVGASAHRVGVS